MKATIIKIIPATPYQDGMTTRYAPEIIEVQAENGDLFSFISGSLNGINDPAIKKVGLEGYLKWIRTASYNLPYFSLTE